MLYLIKSITDPLISLLSEDPVRPSIPQCTRVGENKDIFVLKDDSGATKSILCVSYQNTVPVSEGELFETTHSPTVAVFYTIWSYAPGSGRTLIIDAVKYIEENIPSIKRFVTLSPKTEMARHFHLKNGAIVYRENAETVNFEYVKKGSVAEPGLLQQS